MKTTILTALIFLLLSFIFFCIFVIPIPTGYSAKNMCSSIFLAGMEEDYVRKNDLNFSILGLTSIQVDYEQKTVRSDFIGLEEQLAIFRNEYCGCTLLGEYIRDSSRTFKRKEDLAPNDTLEWPYGNRDTYLTNRSLNKDIEKILSEEFEVIETGTRAIVVVYKGEIIGEQYADPFNQNSLLIGWSMNKSITSTLVGILVQKGIVDIDEVVPIEKWQTDDRKTITWRNLINMNSGLEWNENYNWLSDVTKMLYIQGDVYRSSIDSKLENKPGTKWEYSSGSSNILSGLIRKTLANDSIYYQFPSDQLFDPINAPSFVMELDAVGTYVGSSYVYATARDWAKFGLLYLNNGNWKGNRILPEWWSEFVATPATGSEGIYGGQFWINKGRTFKDVPDDLYFADGFHGQRVFILPSKNLVVVRLGLSKDKKADFNYLLSQIIDSIEAYESI